MQSLRRQISATTRPARRFTRGRSEEEGLPRPSLAPATIREPIIALIRAIQQKPARDRRQAPTRAERFQIQFRLFILLACRANGGRGLQCRATARFKINLALTVFVRFPTQSVYPNCALRRKTYSASRFSLFVKRHCTGACDRVQSTVDGADRPGDVVAGPTACNRPGC